MRKKNSESVLVKKKYDSDHFDIVLKGFLPLSFLTPNFVSQRPFTVSCKKDELGRGGGESPDKSSGARLGIFATSPGVEAFL